MPHEDQREPQLPGKIRVVCEACGARYQVRDTKVRGRRFRATCKRCGGIIVAQSTAFSVSAGAGQPVSSVSLEKDELPQDEDACWYVVISGKPHGPMTAAELGEFYDSRKITARSYIWRAGQPNWIRLAEAPELHSLVGEQATSFFRGPEHSSEESRDPASDTSDPEGTRAAVPRHRRKRALADSGASGALAARLQSEIRRAALDGGPDEDAGYDERDSGDAHGEQFDQAPRQRTIDLDAEPFEEPTGGAGKSDAGYLDDREPYDEQAATSALGPLGCAPEQLEAEGDATRMVSRDNLRQEAGDEPDRGSPDPSLMTPPPLASLPVLPRRRAMLPAPTGAPRRPDLVPPAPPAPPLSIPPLTVAGSPGAPGAPARAGLGATGPLGSPFTLPSPGVPALSLPGPSVLPPPGLPPPAQPSVALADPPSPGLPPPGLLPPGLAGSPGVLTLALAGVAGPPPLGPPSQGAMGSPAGSPLSGPPLIAGAPPQMGASAAAPRGPSLGDEFTRPLRPEEKHALQIRPGGAAPALIGRSPGGLPALSVPPMLTPSLAPALSSRASETDRVPGFWTTGKVAALAAIGGGLAVACAVVIVVTLVRGRGEEGGVNARPARVRPRGPESKAPEVPIVIKPTSARPAEPSAPHGAVVERSPEESSAAEGKSDPAEVRPTPSPGSRVKLRRVTGKPAHGTAGKSVGGGRGSPVADADELLAEAAGSSPAKASSPTPKARAAKGGKPEVNVDDLLSQSAGHGSGERSSGGSSSAKASPSADLPERPSPDQIKAGMRAVLGQVMACYDKFRQPGVVMLKVTLRPDGSHSQTALDPFAGTPTGFCVAGAVERARFPRFSGPAFSITYPFSLKP